MNTLIFFREGLSGHYLKSLITDYEGVIDFRVDPWYPGIYNDPSIHQRNTSCACLHFHMYRKNWQQIIQRYDLILTIQVRNKIYHAIYNNFYKKYLVENPELKPDFDSWTNNLVFWYDTTYYNIKEYHALYQEDLKENQFENVVEFDQLLDVDYIENFMQQYFKKSLTNNMRRIISEYSQKQLQLDLDDAGPGMDQIVSKIPEHLFLESPWWASYCIFKYENLNGLQESQRQWSIDQVHQPINKMFLFDIASKYQL